VLTTTDIDALDACEKFVTPEMKAKMDSAEGILGGGDEPEEPGEGGGAGAGAAPKGPAPTWDGASNDCAAVGDRVVALAMWQMSGDEDTAAAAAGMMGQIKDEVVKSCKEANWPEAARVCILKAASIEAMDACGAQLGGGLRGGGVHPRVARQAEVVVGREVDHLAPVEDGSSAGRPLERPGVQQETLLVELGEPLLQEPERPGHRFHATASR